LNKIEKYQQLINEEIESLKLGQEPADVYDPIYYMLSIGGKRLRPLMVVLAYEMFRSDANKIIHSALAVELFHNFTLVHDDIMDKAPLRRGKQTIHEKWNPNVAILSGDVMFVKVYQMLQSVEATKLPHALELFNKCAIEVCEGQQLDMNFERRNNVSEGEYLEMIRLKTAVLLGFSLNLGGYLGGADEEQCRLLKELGENMGVGFQLKDDILDVYGDKDKFGKQVGGDIIANKKTLLLLTAQQMVQGDLKTKLDHWLSVEDYDPVKKVEAVTSIYNSLGIREIAEAKMNEFFKRGFHSLEEIDVPKEKKETLLQFASFLINRDH